MTIMFLGPSFRSNFISTIKSLISSDLLLTSFDLAKASLYAFSWLYILVCAVVQKYHEISWFIIIYNFSAHFAINLFYLHNLKT